MSFGFLFILHEINYLFALDARFLAPHSISLIGNNSNVSYDVQCKLPIECVQSDEIELSSKCQRTSNIFKRPKSTRPNVEECEIQASTNMKKAI